MYILTYKRKPKDIIKLSFKHLKDAKKQEEILTLIGYKVLRLEYKKE